MVDIRMENRRYGDVRRHFFRVVRANRNPDSVNVRFLDCALVVDQALDLIFDDVSVRRIAKGLHNANALVVGK
jgi:hypothetical protein